MCKKKIRRKDGNQGSEMSAGGSRTGVSTGIEMSAGGSRRGDQREVERGEMSTRGSRRGV